MSSRTPRWSFSIWGLMQFVLAAAVAVATGKNVAVELLASIEALQAFDPLMVGAFGKWWWVGRCVAGIASAILAPVAALLAISLFFQAGRIFRSVLGANPGPSNRFHCNFQWLGRIALGMILLGCVLVDAVFTPETFGLGMAEEFIWRDYAKSLRRALMIVAMIACLAWGLPFRNQARQRPVLSWCASMVVLLAAMPLALLLWGDGSSIHRLVFMAVLGIESAQPLKFADPSVSVLLMDRVNVFYRLSGFAAIAALASVGCCRWFAAPSLTWRVRLPLGALLLAGWSIQAMFLHWVFWDGIRMLSPAWPHANALQYAHVAWTAILLAVLLAAIAAYRISLHTHEEVSITLAPQSLPQPWRFHESQLALALVALGAAGEVFSYVWQDYVDSESCLWLALLVFAVSRTWRKWRDRRLAAAHLTGQLPCYRFLSNTCVLLITFALAAPTLGLFGFIFWMGPINWVRVFESM